MAAKTNASSSIDHGPVVAAVGGAILAESVGRSVRESMGAIRREISSLKSKMEPIQARLDVLNSKRKRQENGVLRSPSERAEFADLRAKKTALADAVNTKRLELNNHFFVAAPMVDLMAGKYDAEDNPAKGKK